MQTGRGPARRLLPTCKSECLNSFEPQVAFRLTSPKTAWCLPRAEAHRLAAGLLRITTGPGRSGRRPARRSALGRAHGSPTSAPRPYRGHVDARGGGTSPTANRSQYLDGLRSCRRDQTRVLGKPRGAEAGVEAEVRPGGIVDSTPRDSAGTVTDTWWSRAWCRSRLTPSRQNAHRRRRHNVRLVRLARHGQAVSPERADDFAADWRTELERPAHST